MTEVLFPSQSFDSHQFANNEWFLNPGAAAAAAPTGNERNLASAPVTLPSAAAPQPSQISEIPARTDLIQDHRSQFNASAFRDLEASMPQPNPLETSPSQTPSISHPTLFSNIKSSGSLPDTPAAASRSFAPIAPDPVGLQRIQAFKQHHDAEDTYEQRSKKRRLTSSSMEAPSQPPPLRDEDKLLLQLKDEQSLPWKDIASRFQTETGKVHMIPALQMRYKRLKERLQVWTDPDVEALKQAHEYWETKKFDIISSKMLEFGATEKFSPRACQKKWQEMNPQADYLQSLAVVPPGFSQSSTTSVSPQPRQMPGHHSMYGSAGYGSALYGSSEASQQQYSSMASTPHGAYTSAPAFHPHSSYAPTQQPSQQQYAAAPQGHNMYRQSTAPQQPGGYSQSSSQHGTPQQSSHHHHQQQPHSSSQAAPHRMSTYPPVSHPSGNYWQ